MVSYPGSSRQKSVCLGKMWYIVVFSGFWPSRGSLLRIRRVWSPHPWAFWENPRWLPFHWNGNNFIPIRHRRLMFSGVCQSIERILSSAKLWHHQKIQYGRQDCCRSGYYSNSVHSYPRDIILVSIPRFSSFIVQFKVKGVQVLSTTPNVISYQQICSNTSSLTVWMSWSIQMTTTFIQ